MKCISATNRDTSTNLPSFKTTYRNLFNLKELQIGTFGHVHTMQFFPRFLFVCLFNVVSPHLDCCVKCGSCLSINPIRLSQESEIRTRDLHSGSRSA